MKQKLGILIFTIVCSVFFFDTVQAKTIAAEEVENGSYVIGEHLFTKDYKTISTATYMLAAKTISSNQLEDMIIYYKDWNGRWINASTGDFVSVPSQFTIHYINLQTETEVHQEELKQAISLNGVLGYTSNIEASSYFSSKSYQVYLTALDLGMNEQYGDGYRYRNVDEHILALEIAKDQLLVQKSLLQLKTLLEQAKLIDRDTHVGSETDFSNLDGLLPVIQEKYTLESFGTQLNLEQEIHRFHDLLLKFQLKEQENFDRVYQEFLEIYQKKEQLTETSVQQLSAFQSRLDQEKISLANNEDLLLAIEQIERLLDGLHYLEEEYLTEVHRKGRILIEDKAQFSSEFQKSWSDEAEASFAILQQLTEKQTEFLNTHTFRETLPEELQEMTSEYETSYLACFRNLFSFLYEQIDQEILPNPEIYQSETFANLQAVMLESTSIVSEIEQVSLSELELMYQKLSATFRALERV